MSLQPIPILGYDQAGGLQTNKKPFLIPNTAFQKLENAYVFRDRILKREGIKLLGRLQRILSGESLGNSGASPWSFNIFSTLSITGEPDAQIVPGSVEIAIGATIFTDNGDGTLSDGPGNSGTINYSTGDVILTHTAGVGVATTIDFTYEPGLPVMGISLREISAINDEQTIWFDTKYAYIWNGSSFQEFIAGTTWDGSDSDFFWTTNYRGVNPQDRLYFATNFHNTAGSPMRYTDGTTWTTFAPAVDGTNFLFQARILIPYYGRLLALNTYEGTAIGASANIFNRCRFSQIGSPVAADAWRSDQVGKGGFLDAPTNEAIVGATFLNNTLIVFFERTTWQLRYVGEYGLPFFWERVDADLGSESTFSTVLLNNKALAVGDKGIIYADSNIVKKIDEVIPNLIFNFQNGNNGPLRIQGIRDYQKEIVYWCYPDAQTQAAPGTALTFPNKVLVYNYKNDSWGIFRDNVTAFGTFQSSSNITWDSVLVEWDDEDVTWDDFDTQSLFPYIVSGNQEGFVHLYGYTSSIHDGDQSSLSITGVADVTGVLTLTIPNHNLADGEVIFIDDLLFVDSATLQPVSTDLNGTIYSVQVVDPDTVSLLRFDFSAESYFTNFTYTPDLDDNEYIGGGRATYLPKLLVQTKDFNPALAQGGQTKLSYLDFLMDVPGAPPTGSITGATKANPCVITSASHGLFTGQQIMISNVVGMTQLNTGQTYRITKIDANSFSIDINSTNFSTYTSGGTWTLVLAGMSVQIYLNSSPAISGNLLVGNKQVSNYGTMPFYGPASDYQWHRFYATCAGQFYNIVMTYDNALMNTLTTHEQSWVLNAMNMWVRPGGKLVF